MNKRWLVIIFVCLLCLGLGGCSLARPEQENASVGKLCGVWVAVSDEPNDVEPDGFQDENAIVIMNKQVKDTNGDYIESVVQGNVMDVEMNVSDVITNEFNNGSGKVYLNSGGKRIYVKTISLYQKTDGSIYADTGGYWEYLESYSSSKHSVSNTYTATSAGKTTEEKIQYDISFEMTEPLTKLKLVFLSEDYKVLDKKTPDLKNLKENTEGLSINAPESCNLVLVEETRASNDGTIKTKYSSYSIDDINEENVIEHFGILQGNELVAKLIPVNIKMQK